MHYLYTWRLVLLGSLLALLLRPTAGRAQAPAWQTAIQAPPGQSEVLATAADSSGNVYLAGYFFGTVNFGPFRVSSIGNKDMFVAQWNLATQQFAWVQHTGGAGGTEGRALAVRGGHVYVAGVFAKTVAFGATSLTGVSQNLNGFVAALSAGGTWEWAQALVGPGEPIAAALAVSGRSIYVAGYFENSLTLGSLSLTCTSNYRRAAYVAKLTEAGAATTFTWAKAATGDTYSQGMALAASGATVYLGGNYSGGTTTLDGLALPESPTGQLNGFVAQLHDAGSSAHFEWTQAIAGRTYTLVKSLAVSDAAVYVGGTAGPGAQFGSLTLPALLDESGFVARLTDSGSRGSFTWVSAITNPIRCEVTAVAASGPQVYVAGSYSGSLTLGPSTIVAGGSSIFVARLLDASVGYTYTWAATSTALRSAATATSLALSGTSVCVGGFANAPLAFGSTTLAPITYLGTGLLAVLPGAVLASVPPAGPTPTWVLSPNPASGAAFLAGAAPATAGQVVDALGRQVATFTTDAEGAAALPAPLLPGVYVVRVGEQSGRLVVN